MLKNEAQWIASELGLLDDAALFPFVNLGSSSARLREVDQPFIDEIVFAPLRRRGSAIVHVDGKAEPGVDLVLDLAEPAAWDSIRALHPRCVLCSNVFEHVTDRAGLARQLADLLEPGAHLLVTVPHVFPYHPDPIDTGFRPDVDELIALFPRLTVRRAANVSCGRLLQLVSGHELRIARKLAGLVRSRIRRPAGATAPRETRLPLDWFKHLVVPFRISCALFVQ